jgi:hypothetical protein
MKSAEPVVHGVIKVEWLDGFVGLVDVRSVLATMPMFEFIRSDEERFRQMQLEPYGHNIFWLDDDSDPIAFGSAMLRERAERQSEILRLAS